jgi:thiosulfate reductase cytochrome b subunit
MGRERKFWIGAYQVTWMVIPLMVMWAIPAAAQIHPDVPLVDTEGHLVRDTGGPLSAIRTCGGCHDTEFIRQHSLHASMLEDPPTKVEDWLFSHPSWDLDAHQAPSNDEQSLKALDRRYLGSGAVERGLSKGGDGAKSNPEVSTADLNCFICHLEQPDNEERLRTIRAGKLNWASTATLANTEVVSFVESGFQWSQGAFDDQGKVTATQLGLRSPANDNCGQCHGLVHTDPKEALSIYETRSDRHETDLTGQVVSGQRLSDSAVNLAGKAELTRAWDVHAERLVPCRQCHFSPNSPASLVRESPGSPDHLRVSRKRLSIGDYLVRPDHRLANAPSQPGTITGCEGCHAAEISHDWLPYQQRHFGALSCTACHVPKLFAPAIKMIDWTVLAPGGEPNVMFRGGDPNDPRSLIHGYVPALISKPDGRLAPNNVVGIWYWSGDGATPLPRKYLSEVYFDDGVNYRHEVESVFDEDGDGRLTLEELRLNSDLKTTTIRDGLIRLGVPAPVIVSKIAPRSISHSVASGEWSTRDCQVCHGEDSIIGRPFEIASFLPGGAIPDLEGSLEDGALQRDVGGELVFMPTAAGVYILGSDRAGWASFVGMGSVLLALFGVGVHSAGRWMTRDLNGVRADVVRVEMYSVYERLWHWLQAGGILALLITGAEIHYAGRFVLLGFEVAVIVHNVLGSILVVNAILSAFYHFASGEIQQYVPRGGFFGQALDQVKYYTQGIFRGANHPFEKRADRKLNPLQQVTYLVILNLLLPIQVVTGVLTWGAQRWPVVSESMGGLTLILPIHTLCSWLFITFLIVHIYLTTTGSTPLSGIRSMVYGWEEVEAEQAEGRIPGDG